MLCFGSSGQRFLKNIYRILEPVLHLLATTVKVSFVSSGQEEGWVKERRLCQILGANEKQGLFVNVGENQPRWYLSYANVDGVWLFRPGDCEDPVLILQTFPRCEIQRATIDLVEALYRKREEGLRYLAEIIESLRGSFEESVGQEEDKVSVLIA